MADAIVLYLVRSKSDNKLYIVEEEELYKKPDHISRNSCIQVWIKDDIEECVFYKRDTDRDVLKKTKRAMEAADGDADPVPQIVQSNKANDKDDQTKEKNVEISEPTEPVVEPLELSTPRTDESDETNGKNRKRKASASTTEASEPKSKKSKASKTTKSKALKDVNQPSTSKDSGPPPPLSENEGEGDDDILVDDKENEQMDDDISLSDDDETYQKQVFGEHCGEPMKCLSKKRKVFCKLSVYDEAKQLRSKRATAFACHLLDGVFYPEILKKATRSGLPCRAIKERRSQKRLKLNDTALSAVIDFSITYAQAKNWTSCTKKEVQDAISGKLSKLHIGDVEIDKNGNKKENGSGNEAPNADGALNENGAQNEKEDEN